MGAAADWAQSFDAGGARMHGGAGGAGIGEQRAEGPGHGDFAEVSSIGHVPLSYQNRCPEGIAPGKT